MGSPRKVQWDVEKLADLAQQITDLGNKCSAVVEVLKAGGVDRLGLSYTKMMVDGLGWVQEFVLSAKNDAEKATTANVERFLIEEQKAPKKRKKE